MKYYEIGNTGNMPKNIPKNKINKRLKTYLTEKQLDIAKNILSILAIGTVLAIAVVAPNAVQLLKIFSRKQYRIKKFNNRNTYKTINKMIERGWVGLSQKDGITTINITKEGKTEHLKFDLENMIINKPAKWDGQWRIVIFDIPEEHKEAREILRSTLKRLGFYKWQKSVFILPYECEKEITYIKEIYEVSMYVKIIIANKIDDETFLKQKFDLEIKN